MENEEWSSSRFPSWTPSRCREAPNLSVTKRLHPRSRLVTMLPRQRGVADRFRAGGWLVTKKEMAKTIAEEMGLTQQQVQEVVQRVLDGITETLLQEGRIELRIFGVFEVRKRKPRKARNPRTGEK